MSATKFQTSVASTQLDRYRERAEFARREAQRAEGDARESYLFLADQWERLARNLTSIAESKVPGTRL